MQKNNQTKFKETEIGTIPEDWNLEVLKNLTIKIGSGATPRGGSSVYSEDGPYALIRSQNIFDDKFEYSGLAHINEQQAKELSNVEVKENDVLLNITGASLGRVNIVPKKVLPARVNQHVSILRVNEKLDPYFLKSFLVLPNIKSYILGHNAGATREAITKEMIENFFIPVPVLSEQRQIAEILSSLDDKIELNRKINANLEKTASMLFKHWFVDFEFPNGNGEPYKFSGGKMAESELGEIPEGWEAIPMASAFDFLEGPGIRNWQYAESGTRFINIRLIDGGNINVNAANYINQTDVDTKYQHFLLKENDMILSASGTLGKSAIVRKSHLPLLLNTSVIRFRPKNGIGYPFLYQYLQSRYFLEEQVRLSAGSVQANFGPTHLNKMSVCVPNEKLLDDFNKACGSMYDQIIVNLNQNENLSLLRDALLPRLMGGKIRVK